MKKSPTVARLRKKLAEQDREIRQLRAFAHYARGFCEARGSDATWKFIAEKARQITPYEERAF